MAKSRRRDDLSMMMSMSGPSIPQEPNGIPYTHPTARLDNADNEPTTRSVDRVRSPEEFEASRTRMPEPGEGYTLRIAMTNQEVNDQFPYLPKGKRP